MLGHFRSTLTFLRGNIRICLMLDCLSALWLGILIGDLHGLIQFVLDHLPCRRFHIFKCDGWLLAGSLRLETLSLGLHVVLVASRESLAHVGVALVFLVDQVVSRSDMVVTVCFQASDRVLLFKLKVVYESLEKITRVGHLLKPWEKSWLTRFGKSFFLRSSHVGVVPDL